MEKDKRTMNVIITKPKGVEVSVKLTVKRPQRYDPYANLLRDIYEDTPQPTEQCDE